MSQVINANTVARALAKRHREKDLFFTEVKNGSTWFASGDGHLRMDGLAIAKSWTRPCFTGYEIKVSRSDWLRDKKFVNYLPLCHELYIVAPPNVLVIEELPKDVGFMMFYPESGKCITKRKASYRNIEIPADMLMYLLMNYAHSEERPTFKQDRRALIEAYLQDKADDRDLGRALQTKMTKRLAELATAERDIENMRHQLLDRDDRDRKVKDYLAQKLGVSYVPNTIHGIQQVERMLATSQIDPEKLVELFDQTCRRMSTELRNQLLQGVQYGR